MSKNILSVEAFADWAEQQEPEREYDYSNGFRCACAQYAEFLGVPYRTISDIKVAGHYWAWGEQKDVESVAAKYPHTFGALAARLRAAS